MSRNIRHDALQGNAQDSMNIALATAVQGHMLKGPLAIKEGISMVDRGIKRARYSVLCTIKHPAILVEGGFMSNPQEALLIATERYQNFMASSLAAAVHQYRTALGQQVRKNALSSLTVPGPPFSSMNIIRIPGLADYQETLRLQEQLVRAHQEDPDRENELLLLEHAGVYTYRAYTEPRQPAPRFRASLSRS